MAQGWFKMRRTSPRSPGSPRSPQSPRSPRSPQSPQSPQPHKTAKIDKREKDSHRIPFHSTQHSPDLTRLTHLTKSDIQTDIHPRHAPYPPTAPHSSPIHH
eukprot:GHVN01092646.1.p2 GENE.GHVN01092646.1~~GHVN01092646.1.p2  ORF type:complete len:101 (+),score=52.79 GHVN01092646.1:582-884(+)